jgi:hypothetical protein
MAKTIKKTIKKAVKKTRAKREFKPKEWLRKPDEEKKVQGYYYVKAKYRQIAKEEILKLTQQWR